MPQREVVAMKWMLTLLLAVVVLAVVGVSAFVNKGQSGADAGPKSVEIMMTEMRFSPNRIDARAGQSVLVTIVNRGSERHDLAFPSIGMPDLRGVETLTMPGQSSRLTISFDAPGTYLFLCTIPGHAAAGMTGAVFVSP